MSVAKNEYKKITTHSLQEMKQNGERISMMIHTFKNGLKI